MSLGWLIHQSLCVNETVPVCAFAMQLETHLDFLLIDSISSKAGISSRFQVMVAMSYICSGFILHNCLLPAEYHLFISICLFNLNFP
jgi:hypothetical protein